MELARPLARAAVCTTTRALPMRAATRSYAVASSYVPSAAASRITPLPPRNKPALPTFFTGRPTYENALLDLESIIQKSQAKLREMHIYPLPRSLAVPQPKVVWRSATDMSSLLELSKLKTAQYRRVTSLLGELAVLREIAKRAGQAEVVTTITEALEGFERSDVEGSGFTSTKPDGMIDQYGRSVSVGKRKESSAKVWLSKTKIPNADASSSAASATDLPITGESQIPTTQILVNSLPIHVHFPSPAHREYILRPLRLTGLIGHYNIFAQTQGGGMTGQAGAITLAVARGLATLRPELREVLLQDGLLKRDPRMVERKKTGLAKARKRYTWVKR